MLTTFLATWKDFQCILLKENQNWTTVKVEKQILFRNYSEYSMCKWEFIAKEQGGVSG